METKTEVQSIQSKNGQSPDKGNPPTFPLKDPKTHHYIAMLKWLGYEFRINDLDESIELNGERLKDYHESLIYNAMHDMNMGNRGRARDAWVQVASENRYHPVKEMLLSLEWNKRDHIGHFVDKYLVETTGFGATAFRRFFVGCVAKVLEQGQNFMLVWDAPQDCGKSTLARWLCPWPRYFIEGAIRPENKDFLFRACNHLLWEVGELQATTRKADKEALKDFITKKIVIERRPFGKNDLVKPVLASLIGTINEDGAGFLTDPTGSRRFVIIKIKEIKFSYRKEVNPMDLWAQAVALYLSGEKWELDKEEKAKRNQINAGYEIDSIVASYFFRCYRFTGNNDYFESIADILRTLEQEGLRGNQRSNAMELARLMKKMGIEKSRVKGDRGYSGISSLR